MLSFRLTSPFCDRLDLTSSVPLEPGATAVVVARILDLLLLIDTLAVVVFFSCSMPLLGQRADVADLSTFRVRKRIVRSSSVEEEATTRWFSSSVLLRRVLLGSAPLLLGNTLELAATVIVSAVVLRPFRLGRLMLICSRVWRRSVKGSLDDPETSGGATDAPNPSRLRSLQRISKRQLLSCGPACWNWSSLVTLTKPTSFASRP